jgi:eukaryotic-like serine/threonine-protein kinase
MPSELEHLRDAELTKSEWAVLRQAVESAISSDGEGAKAGTADPRVRSKVQELLDLGSAQEQFLEPPVRGTAGAILEDLIANELIGERFGPYRTIERIGAGGMGTVYRALRDDDAFHRVVAVKVIRQALASPEALRRFHHERNALAQLLHPNVAGLLDGGTTAAGLPYLVLEYVDGVPINEFCEAKQLSIRERVQIFLHVCDAVRHAHQHLIIHRDLKPQNILVTPEGQPKLLDFGVSRLIESEARENTQQTVTLYRALTPRYASPEQVRGEATSTTSDVYSLGVVLYELLTGRSPRDLGESLGDAIESFNQHDARVPSHFGAGIGRDLDSVLMKALSTKPADRYPSAEALAEELSRYLRGLPVVARPVSRVDSGLKWMRRNRAASGLLATVFMLVVVFVAVLSVMIVRLDQRRKAALRAQETAERISLFLGSTLEDAEWQGGASGGEIGGDPPNVRDLLDRAIRRAGVDLAKFPSAEASVRLTVGRSYLAMGLIKHSESQFRQSLSLVAAAHGLQSAEYAKALINFAEYLRWAGPGLESHERASEAIEIMRAVVSDPRTDVDLSDTLNMGAASAIIAGVWHDAESWASEAIEIRQRISPVPTPELAAAYERRGVARANTNRGALAEEDLRVAIQIHGRCSAQKGSLGQVRALGTLVRIQVGAGNMASGVESARQALAIGEAMKGPEHPTLCRPLNNLAYALDRAGRSSEALEVSARASRLAQRGLPRWHYHLFVSRYNFGTALTKAGRLAEAEDELLAAYAAVTEMVSEGHMFLNDCTTAIHELYEAWGRTDEAEKWPAFQNVLM